MIYYPVGETIEITKAEAIEILLDGDKVVVTNDDKKRFITVGCTTCVTAERALTTAHTMLGE